MFVFGLSKEEIEKATKSDDRKIISENLYRVQKITTSDYFFRKHLETIIDDSPKSKEMKKVIRISSIRNMNGIKVKVDRLGNISLAK